MGPEYRVQLDSCNDYSLNIRYNTCCTRELPRNSWYLDLVQSY